MSCSHLCTAKILFRLFRQTVLWQPNSNSGWELCWSRSPPQRGPGRSDSLLLPFHAFDICRHLILQRTDSQGHVHPSIPSYTPPRRVPSAFHFWLCEWWMEWREQGRSNPHKSVLLTHLPLRLSGVSLLLLPRRAGGVDVGQVPVVFLSPPFHAPTPALLPWVTADLRGWWIKGDAVCTLSSPSPGGSLCRDGAGTVPERNSADVCHCRNYERSVLRIQSVIFIFLIKWHGWIDSRSEEMLWSEMDLRSRSAWNQPSSSSPQIPATCQEILSTQDIKDSSAAFCSAALGAACRESTLKTM